VSVIAEAGTELPGFGQAIGAYTMSTNNKESSAVIIAVVTFIGLPLALVTMSVWLILLFVGDLPVALWIGKRLLRDRARPGRSGAILCVLVGGLILLVIAFIPLLGALVLIISTVVGTGAILLRSRGPTSQAAYSI